MQPLPPARLVLACLLAAISCALPAQPELDARIEAEPELDAADLVMPALLHGPGYRVDPDVPVVGYQARFLIRTPWGQIPAESREMLALRIAEMPAVEALHDASVSETHWHRRVPRRPPHSGAARRGSRASRWPP